MKKRETVTCVWFFIVDTNKLATFDREMCAYMTGVCGEYGGYNEAADFEDDEGEDLQEEFDRAICRYTPPGVCVEDDYERISDIYASPSGKNQMNSIVIYFEEKPTDKLIEIMKRRATEYAEDNEFEVLGFRCKLQCTKEIVESWEEWTEV